MQIVNPIEGDVTIKNVDRKVADHFGDEWQHFDQQSLTGDVQKQMFGDYFSEFPWDQLPSNAIGADIGCGSGRWARLVAPKVGRLFCLDVSTKALEVARVNLKNFAHAVVCQASVSQMPVEDASLDFAYSLGVLHHVPDTQQALRDIYAKLKPEGVFLVYLYYAFDNRPWWYVLLWRSSDWSRRVISRFPFGLRLLVTQIIATLVYLPLARFAHILFKARVLPDTWPLAYYHDKSFYVMRTDALDRFGTPLEKRYSKTQIHQMLERSGFHDIKFSARAPFWVATAVKPRTDHVPLRNGR